MLPILLTLALMAPGLGQEVFIRNQEFQGEIVSSGSGFLVNLDTLARALELELQGDSQGYVVGEGEAQPGTVLVQGQRISLSPGQFGPLVPLADFCRAVGAELKRNQALGTVDVYLTDYNESAVGNVWLGELFVDDEAQDDVSASEAGSFADPELGYELTFPKSVKLVTAPDRLRVPSIELRDGEGTVHSGDLRCELLLVPKNPAIKQALGTLLTIELDVVADLAIETSLVDGVLKAVTSQSAKISSGPRRRSFHGHEFQQYGFGGTKGKIEYRGDLFFHFQVPDKRAFLFLVVDEKEGYRNNTRGLLQAVRSFKHKDR